MNEKKRQRLLLALGEVDEKYVKEAESKMKVATIVKIAAVFAIVIALSLYLFIPFGTVTGDLSDYEGSSYFSLIEGIEDYRLSLMQPTERNNFEVVSKALKRLFRGPLKNDDGVDADGGSMAPSDGGNGNYVEATDNQVDGVVEADIFKMTDKYIFRIGDGRLFVYSIDKENSETISVFGLPSLNGGRYAHIYDPVMYLSEDCNTVTVLIPDYDEDHKSNISIVALDVSDVENISVKGQLSIQGSLNTSRMADGRLLLVTEYYFNHDTVDYNNPETFVPSVNDGSGDRPIEFENIIFPDKVGNTRYSVVALIDTENLTLLGANALLNFTSDVYVSADNLYISREYTERIDGDGEDFYIQRNVSDVAVLNYSGESLEKKGVITVNGHTKNQYSFDERDGYLRIVTSTNEGREQARGQNVSFAPSSQNVSLYIYDLSDHSLSYSVEDFAIEGESATAVRFDGDKLYVCTAEVVTFTDPVYFFDLSDYENISSADTGIIQGFSTSLINLGEGFLLGIGREDWQYNKVEVYEQRDGQVVSVDEIKFCGSYSENYKTYLVNREENLFGFFIDGYVVEDDPTLTVNRAERYVLLHFDGYELSVVADVGVTGRDTAERVRAAYVDGYLYVTGTTYIMVWEVGK